MNVARNALVAGGHAAAVCVCLSMLLGVWEPAAAAAPQVGVAAPDFSLHTVSGAPWSLSSLRGHVVVVNFFATWCPPCRAETPDLVAIQRRYARKGVIFVGVDDREAASLVAAFAAAKSIRYPVVLDESGTVSEAYDVRAIPTTYVLDRTGAIRYRQVDELNGPLLSQVLDAVIAGFPLPESPTFKKFRDVAEGATSAIGSATRSAQAANPINAAPLNDAIDGAVAANKQLDQLQSSNDSASINYFDATAMRDELDNALADAYALRATIPGSSTPSADQAEEALLRGQVYTDQERFAQALEQYDLAIKLAPHDTRGYDGGYLAAYEMKDYARAADIASAEAAIDASDPESWLTLASAQNDLKEYVKAFDAEREALALASDAYAKTPSSGAAAYELGRVWLKMARTQLLAGNAAAAAPLLGQAQAAAPGTIVAQQASEQSVALEPVAIAIERTAIRSARGENASPARVYVLVRNASAQARTVNLKASGLPSNWLLSFCFATVCNPYKVSFALAGGASKRVELLVAPQSQTGGPWSLTVDATGAPTALVHLRAPTAQAAITIFGS